MLFEFSKPISTCSQNCVKLFFFGSGILLHTLSHFFSLSVSLAHSFTQRGIFELRCFHTFVQVKFQFKPLRERERESKRERRERRNLKRGNFLFLSFLPKGEKGKTFFFFFLSLTGFLTFHCKEREKERKKINRAITASYSGLRCCNNHLCN